MPKPIRISIFASGNGSNAEQLIAYFKNIPEVQIATIMSNKADAFVLKRASKHKIPYHIFDRTVFSDSETFLAILKSDAIDFIILAGFLWLIPPYLVQAYPGKIINIHPALLPKYGGKGMYGSYVHEAVHQSGDTETGITIHIVNEQYDSGAILFQAKVTISLSDTPTTIAEKVHNLEYEHYPKVAHQIVKKVFGV